ncbi:hypothetical protein ACW14Y_42215 [Kitasatospora sp. cg17-2]
MSDPGRPADSPDPGPLEGAGGDRQQAVQTVRAVVSWYSAYLHGRHGAPPATADEDAFALQAAQGRKAAYADLRRLEAGLGAAEVERITARYAALLHELEGGA